MKMTGKLRRLKAVLQDYDVLLQDKARIPAPDISEAEEAAVRLVDTIRDIRARDPEYADLRARLFGSRS